MPSATVEKQIEFEGKTYEVYMTWSPAEYDAGLREGWDECYIALPLWKGRWLSVAFTPDYGDAVRDWIVYDVQINDASRAVNKKHFTNLIAVDDPKIMTSNPREDRPAKLGDFGPDLYMVVKIVWDEIQKQESEEAAKLEEALADAALADYEARYDI